MHAWETPEAAGVFCKLANMLGFELFDLICNLVQESGQGVRFVVANLTDQRVKVGYKTVIISNRFQGVANAAHREHRWFQVCSCTYSIDHFIVGQNVANVNRLPKLTEVNQPLPCSVPELRGHVAPYLVFGSCGIRWTLRRHLGAGRGVAVVLAHLLARSPARPP